MQASSDRNAWTAVDIVIGNTEDVNDVDFDPVLARYLKFIIDPADGDSAVSIADVEIFGARKN